MTLDDLKKQSEELSDKIQKEITQRNKTISEFEKSIALQSNVLLETNYFTVVRPELFERAYEDGLELMYGLMELGRESEVSHAHSNLSDNTQGFNADLKIEYLYPLQGVDLGKQLILSELMAKFYSRYDGFLNEFQEYKSTTDLFLNMKLDVDGSNLKYVQLVKKDEANLIREFFAGYVENVLETVRHKGYMIIEKEDFDVFFKSQDTTVLQSKKFRSYIKEVTNDAKGGDKGALNALGFISPYLQK